MILLTGAQGVVGLPLEQRLIEKECSYLAVSRSRHSKPNQLQWDLSHPASAEILESIEGIDLLIHCAPIWLLPPRLSDLKNSHLKRLIVFSSTSVLSKADSQNAQEQLLVTQLREAEAALTHFCRQQGWQLTLFRPSMIYGYGRDENISRIATMVKRFGFMLMVGQGTGKRQPVHADDLIKASFAVLEKPQSVSKVYNLAGGEVLTYRAMVEKIFNGLGQRPRIISLPLSLVRLILYSAAKLTSFSYTPQMADRMNQDMIYNIEAAENDFDYSPQRFLEQPKRDLPS